MTDNPGKISQKAFVILRFGCASLIVLLSFYQVRSQDQYEWWNVKHNWDGYTHWTNYIIFSPGFMGPNSLPVPRLIDGLVGKRFIIEPEAAVHLQKGEFTAGGGFRLFYPLLDGLAAIEFNQVIGEYYKTDTLLRDERFARSKNVEGFARGDINIATYVTIVRNRCWPDMALRINLRTASGSKLSDARHTDAPGYFFDLSFGKNVITNSDENTPQLRVYGTAGFYVWQTNLENNRQNDAFLTGLGAKLTQNKHSLIAEGAGYFGYLEMRDDPVVVRLIYELTEKQNGLRFQYQKGVSSIYHHTLSISWIIFIMP